jgi:urea transport system ATP-binding protein
LAAEPVLRVDGLNQFYGGSHILRDVAFEARPGEVTVVLGRNGVGKTTLLKTLMGLVPARTGQVVLDGQDITTLPPY